MSDFRQAPDRHPHRQAANPIHIGINYQPQEPSTHDAVLGYPSGAKATDAVLGGKDRTAPRRSKERKKTNRKASFCEYPNALPHGDRLGKILRQCPIVAASEVEVFCQLTPNFQFTRNCGAVYAPRTQAQAVHTEHHHVSQLWGFRGHSPWSEPAEPMIWYNLFYFRTRALKQLLQSIEAGFSYVQLPAEMQQEWDYHFTTTFTQCTLQPTAHSIMAHMAQFYPRRYAVAYSYWQTQYQLDMPPYQLEALRESTIDAVITLANYYLWFQMAL